MVQPIEDQNPKKNMPGQLSRQSAGLLNIEVILWSWVRAPHRVFGYIQQKKVKSSFKWVIPQNVARLLCQLSWLERETVNLKVVGSIPTRSAIYKQDWYNGYYVTLWP